MLGNVLNYSVLGKFWGDDPQLIFIMCLLAHVLWSCFPEFKQLPWIMPFFVCLCIKYIEPEVRLSIALSCGQSHSFRSSDPRLGRQDRHRSTEKISLYHHQSPVNSHYECKREKRYTRDSEQIRVMFWPLQTCSPCHRYSSMSLLCKLS